jgi:hypothetical protein
LATATLVLIAAALLVMPPIRTVALLLLVTLLATNPVPATITLVVLGFLVHLFKKLR